MALLLLRSEADCLVPQHKQNLCLIHSPTLERSPHTARAVSSVGHKEPVAVTFQFSAIRSFSGADVER